MDSLWEDGSYTGEMMLFWGLVQTEREYISQTSIKPVYHYSISMTTIIGTYRRKTSNVVQNIELNAMGQLEQSH